MNQLIALESGNTAHHLAAHMPMIAMRMNKGLKYSVVSVNRVRPRYMKIKFSDNWASAENMYFVVNCVRRDML